MKISFIKVTILVDADRKMDLEKLSVVIVDKGYDDNGIREMLKGKGKSR